MPHYEIWKRIDELKTKPELAGSPGYEIDDLLKKSDAIDWFFLLMEQPQFTPPHDWWFELRSRCDLPWAMLLRKQPQFVPRVRIWPLFFSRVRIWPLKPRFGANSG